MDEEIERLLVSVRADTSAFARDVAEMKGQLEGPLAQGVEQAGRVLETALLRAVRTGRLGFEDLKKAALAAMAEIAAAAIRSGFDAALGSTRGGGAGGLIAAGVQLLGALIGAPGRAGGGPVAPGRAYRVGEQGPELFVPTAAGRVEPARPGGRDVRLSIAISAPPGTEPRALARSSRQVARAVRAALARAGD